MDKELMLHDELTAELERLEGAVKAAQKQELIAKKGAETAVGAKTTAESQAQTIQQKTQEERKILVKLKKERAGIEEGIEDKRSAALREQRQAEKVSAEVGKEQDQLGIETLKVADGKRANLEMEEMLDRKDVRLRNQTEANIVKEKEHEKGIAETEQLKMQLTDTIDKYKRKMELADKRNAELVKATAENSKKKTVSTMGLSNRERDVKYREDAVTTSEKQNEIAQLKLSDDRGVLEKEKEVHTRDKAILKRSQKELERRRKETELNELRLVKLIRDQKIEKEWKESQEESSI